MNLTPNIQNEIKFLDANYSQEEGMHITNMLEMSEEILSNLMSAIADMGLENDTKILRPLWNANTLICQIKNKINSKFFVSVENLVFGLKEEAQA